MEYSFDGYLERLGSNWYQDDSVLQGLLWHFSLHQGGTMVEAKDHAPAEPKPREETGEAREPAQRLHRDLTRWGSSVAGPLRRLAWESARPENRPAVRHWDGLGRRVDEILLPGSTRRALAEVEGREGLGAPHGDAFAFYGKTYLYWQNGEAGVACSMGCTDGLVRVLEALGDRREHQEAVDRIRSSTSERVWHGAQFVTEIQGGSDVPANAVRATPHGDEFRLHGRKWFCSNINADYFLVTARPDGAPAGATGVALFLVPAFDPAGGRERNGHTVDRLKEKLGTRELATAEVTFQGARAFPVGPLDRGLSNLIRYVLVPSRLACVISAAAFLRQAERVADAYAGFRTAFGRTIRDYPLVQEALDDLARSRRRALATVFGLLALWEGNEEERTDFRVLLSLAKSTLTREATEQLRRAMAVLAGNGIEEEFSELPRLFRDSVIMETWEGPHNVLLTQALRDMARFELDGPALVRRLGGAGLPELERDAEDLIRSADDPETTRKLPGFARRLVAAHGDRVLAEAGVEAG